jgi:maleamate amidohydrolase
LSIVEPGDASGFGGTLPFGHRPALLLVDVVVAYLTPTSPLYHARFGQALDSCRALAERARSLDIPVIFTNVAYQAGGTDGGLFYRKVPALSVFAAGGPGGVFPHDLQPLPDEIVVTKQYASAFFGTSLASTLTSMQVDTLLIGGFSTSGCVRASTLDALQHGFAPFVVEDACGDRAKEPHEANLSDLALKYAEVISRHQALTLMMHSPR